MSNLTLKERQQKIKSLHDFAFGLSKQREQHRELGYCTSLDIDGKETLIDIPASVDARREAARAVPKNGIAKMNDEEFIELMGGGK